MFNTLSELRTQFIELVKLIVPEGHIVKPSNESAHYPDSEAVGIEVSPQCVDIYARVLANGVPVYIERSLKEDGSVNYYGKLYKSSDKDGEVFSDLVEEAEAKDITVFAKQVRAWVHPYGLL